MQSLGYVIDHLNGNPGGWHPIKGDGRKSDACLVIETYGLGTFRISGFKNSMGRSTSGQSLRRKLNKSIDSVEYDLFVSDFIEKSKLAGRTVEFELEATTETLVLEQDVSNQNP